MGGEGRCRAVLIGVCQVPEHNGRASCPDNAPSHRSMGDINTPGIALQLWQPGRQELGMFAG